MSDSVSVIIPTHNYARFVGRAVDSALGQTHAPAEVIVVDDGSTDDTPKVLAGYGDRVRVIRQVRRGPAVARNAGIRAARGDLVALLDSDDHWRPQKLARQVAALRADPAPGAVGCGSVRVDAAGRVVAEVIPRSPPAGVDLTAQLRGVALRDVWVGGSCSGALIPRRVLDEVGLFDESLTAAEDWDLWLRVAARYPIRNVPEALVTITLHGTGFARDADRVERNQWKVFAAVAAGRPDAFDRRLRRRVRALILADAGAEYIGDRAYGRALSRYAASLRAWPLDRQRWYAAARLLLRQVGI